MELVKLPSKYDPVLKEHLVRLKQTSRHLRRQHVTYLSPQTQNEFIGLLAAEVKRKLIAEIKSAKHYGIIFDRTPDIFYTAKMSEIIRFVHVDCQQVQIKKVFLGFFVLTGKKAMEVTDAILKQLEVDCLHTGLCTSQGYDNAANKAGIHAGVQAIIAQINPKAVFNGCVDHSLNLCWQHSFAESPE